LGPSNNALSFKYVVCVSIPLTAGACSVRSEDEVGEEGFGADIHEETDLAGGLLTLGVGDCQAFSSVDRHLYLSVDVDLQMDPT